MIKLCIIILKEAIYQVHFFLIINQSLINLNKTIAKDFGGTSDPFCKIQCGKSHAQTNVVWKTLNPVWVKFFFFFFFFSNNGIFQF
jgi:hypothetical protein